MNELLRFTAPGQNGINILFPPKFEFVFYSDKFEMYKKGKLVRTTFYQDVMEVRVVKNWQNNVLLNHQFKIDNKNIIISGLCENCLGEN